MGRPVVGPTTFIVSRTADPGFIRESPTIYGAGTTPPLEQVIRERAATEFGGVANDYAVIWNSDPTVLERLGKGDAHTVSWDGVDEENDAVYDFSPEDNKIIIRTEVSKNSFEANNVDSVSVTLMAYIQGTSSIATNINATRLAPIASPMGRRYIEVTFVNGVAGFVLKGNAALANGDWTIPDPDIADTNSKVDEESFKTVKGYVTAF